MKFANYYSLSRNLINIGDWLIFDSKKYIYSYMGIKNEDVINLSNLNIMDYKGEPLVLNACNILVNIPDYIMPCYIGFFASKKLNKIETEHLKKYEPIGCRDHFTLQECINNGIKAYYSGCTTVVLPKKERGNSQKHKCFLVDIPKEAENYIPNSIMKNSVRVTQLAEYESEESIQDIYNNYYNAFLNEASVVITSRLHCAMFCLNHGIPVIVMRDYYVSRMTTVNRFIPVYDKSQWGDIDFNPSAVCIDESIKQAMIESASSRLWEMWYKHNSYEGLSALHTFYDGCNNNNYVTLDSYVQNIIQDKFPDKNAKFAFSVWGVNCWSEAVYEYISENYPNAVLANVYDAYREVDFYCHTSKPISKLKENIESEICFVGCGEDIASRLEMIKQYEIDESRLVFINVIGKA